MQARSGKTTIPSYPPSSMGVHSTVLSVSQTLLFMNEQRTAEREPDKRLRMAARHAKLPNSNTAEAGEEKFCNVLALRYVMEHAI